MTPSNRRRDRRGADRSPAVPHRPARASRPAPHAGDHRPEVRVLPAPLALAESPTPPVGTGRRPPGPVQAPAPPSRSPGRGGRGGLVSGVPVGGRGGAPRFPDGGGVPGDRLFGLCGARPADGPLDPGPVSGTPPALGRTPRVRSSSVGPAASGPGAAPRPASARRFAGCTMVVLVDRAAAVPHGADRAPRAGEAFRRIRRGGRGRSGTRGPVRGIGYGHDRRIGGPR